MNTLENPEVPVAPEHEEWSARPQRRARLALPPERKAADARLKAVGLALSDATRWRILLELGKGDALPVGELARRTGKRPDAVSKHVALLRKAGLVEKIFSSCYTLPAAMIPAPGATHIDLGPCLLKLAPPQ